MELTEKQKEYLSNKYESVLIFEQMPEYAKNEFDVLRKDYTDHSSIHILTDDEISLLLSLSKNKEVNNTLYSEQKSKTAQKKRGLTIWITQKKRLVLT